MKGSNNLKVLTFNQSIIFLQQAFSALKIPMCKCQNRKIACKICHKMFISECRANKIIERQVIQTQILQTKRENSQQIDQKQYYKKQKQHAKDMQQNCLNEQQQFDLPRHLLLIVVVRLSVKNIPKSSFDGVLQLISHYTSIGIIGGIPKKALYFTGRCNQELVYLDPHYVQQSVNRRSFENLRGTFHCQEFRKMQYTQIDPSMGLGFYIKNLRDLQSLAVLMAKLKQRKKNDFISIMWGNMDIERKSSEFSQSFEFCQLSDDQNQQDFS